MKRVLLQLGIALLAMCGLPAQAHKASDSYLTLRLSGNRIDGQWDIALRDLDAAIGLDGDGNGELTWDEIRARHAGIAAYALSRLQLSSGGRDCPARAREHLIDEHSDGAYEVMRFDAVCAEPVRELAVGYRLLFDIDAQHKGLLRLERDGQTVSAIFSPEHAGQTFAAAQPGRWRQFADYLRHGVWHIWIGFDHILFLLSLLLPAVLVLRGDQWKSSDSFRASLFDVLKIVTAFTLAHSITLTLATLKAVTLPSRWVESAIAASVVVAALNNLFPLLHGRRWIAAFAFGLIHGFGFASVLADLGLPQSSLLLALLGFNLGVEIGQVAIVAAFLPLAYTSRQTWLYRKVVFNAGSLLIALVASIWLAERALDVKLV
ncbi:MAG: HupE/UreJ family protein [Bacillota bacterium]